MSAILARKFSHKHVNMARSRLTASLANGCSEFEEVATSLVVGRVTGALRSGLRWKLTNRLTELFGEESVDSDFGSQ